jgi:hypothetical protein
MKTIYLKSRRKHWRYFKSNPDAGAAAMNQVMVERERLQREKPDRSATQENARVIFNETLKAAQRPGKAQRVSFFREMEPLNMRARAAKRTTEKEFEDGESLRKNVATNNMEDTIPSGPVAITPAPAIE